MSPRERVLKAIALETPDRVPIDISMRTEVFEKLREHLGFSPEKSERVYEALGMDTRGTGLRMKSRWGVALTGSTYVSGGPEREGFRPVRREGRFEVGRDVWGVESIWAPDRTYTFTLSWHPLQHMGLEEYPWPEIDLDSIKWVQATRQRYEDYCLYGTVTHVFQRAWWLLGFNQTIVEMYRNSKLINQVLDRLGRLRIEQGRLLAEAGVDAFTSPDDVGAQRGLMMHPDLWRRHLKPRLAEFIRAAHSWGVKVAYHTDGDVRAILPDLVEIGLDVLDPVQPECMHPLEVKRLSKGRVCLQKTIGTQSTLPFGTPEAVKETVWERIRTLGPAGLILGPCNAVQPDVPPENLIALCEAVKSYPYA